MARSAFSDRLGEILTDSGSGIRESEGSKTDA
jgi:hypothetical protein